MPGAARASTSGGCAPPAPPAALPASPGPTSPGNDPRVHLNIAPDCAVPREIFMAENGAFLSDIKELRKRAREHMDDGPVTPGYSADRERVIQVLNDALATEMVCVLRYKRHYYMAQGLSSEPVAQEFLEHAQEE